MCACENQKDARAQMASPEDDPAVSYPFVDPIDQSIVRSGDTDTEMVESYLTEIGTHFEGLAVDPMNAGNILGSDLESIPGIPQWLKDAWKQYRDRYMNRHAYVENILKQASGGRGRDPYLSANAPDSPEAILEAYGAQKAGRGISNFRFTAKSGYRPAHKQFMEEVQRRWKDALMVKGARKEAPDEDLADLLHAQPSPKPSEVPLPGDEEPEEPAPRRPRVVHEVPDTPEPVEPFRYATMKSKMGSLHEEWRKEYDQQLQSGEDIPTALNAAREVFEKRIEYLNRFEARYFRKHNTEPEQVALQDQQTKNAEHFENELVKLEDFISEGRHNLDPELDEQEFAEYLDDVKRSGHTWAANKLMYVNTEEEEEEEEDASPESSPEPSPSPERELLRPLTTTDQQSFVARISPQLKSLSTLLGNQLYTSGWQIRLASKATPKLKSQWRGSGRASRSKRKQVSEEDLETVSELANELYMFDRKSRSYEDTVELMESLRDTMAGSELFGTLRTGMKTIDQDAKTLLANLGTEQQSPFSQHAPRTKADLKLQRGLPQTPAEQRFREIESTSSQKLVHKLFTSIRGAKAEKKAFAAGTAENRMEKNMTEWEIESLSDLAKIPHASKMNNRQRINSVLNSEFVRGFMRDMRPGTSVGDVLDILNHIGPVLGAPKRQPTVSAEEYAFAEGTESTMGPPEPREAVFVPDPKPKKRGGAKPRRAVVDDVHPIYNVSDIDELDDVHYQVYLDRFSKNNANSPVERIFHGARLLSQIFGTRAPMRSGKSMEMHGPFSMYHQRNEKRYATHPETNNQSMLRSVMHDYGIVPVTYDRSNPDHSKWPGQQKTRHEFDSLIYGLHHTRNIDTQSVQKFAEYMFGDKRASDVVPRQWKENSPLWNKIKGTGSKSLFDWLIQHGEQIMERDHQAHQTVDHTLQGNAKGKTLSAATVDAYKDLTATAPNKALEKQWKKRGYDEPIRKRLNLHHHHAKQFTVAELAAYDMFENMFNILMEKPQNKKRNRNDVLEEMGIAERSGEWNFDKLHAGTPYRPVEPAAKPRPRLPMPPPSPARPMPVVRPSMAQLFRSIGMSGPSPGPPVKPNKAILESQKRLEDLQKQQEKLRADRQAAFKAAKAKAQAQALAAKSQAEAQALAATKAKPKPKPKSRSASPETPHRVRRKPKKDVAVIDRPVGGSGLYPPMRLFKDMPDSGLAEPESTKAPENRKLNRQIFRPRHGDTDTISKSKVRAAHELKRLDRHKKELDAANAAGKQAGALAAKSKYDLVLDRLWRRRTRLESFYFPDKVAPVKSKPKAPVIPPAAPPAAPMRPPRRRRPKAEQKDPEGWRPPPGPGPALQRPGYAPIRGQGGLGVVVPIRVRDPNRDAQLRARRHLQRTHVYAQPSASMWNSTGYTATTTGDLLPPSMGRMHVVHMGATSNKNHFMTQLDADANMGAKARKRGTFKARRGPSMVMSRSTNTSIRKRGPSIEMTVRRGATEYEMESLIGKLTAHMLSTKITWVYLLHGGRKRKVGRLSTIDLQRLKARVVKLLMEHREVGILLVDEGNKGKMHRPGVHHVTRRNFNSMV